MGVVDRGELIKALKKKGFTEEHGTNHDKFCFRWNGKNRFHTLISRGTESKDLRDRIAGLIAKQMYLTNGEFKEFVECTLTAEGYVKLLKNRLIIEPD